MAVTFLNLSGTIENPDKTIRALLEDNWSSANTSNITPEFQSDSEEPDNRAQDDMEGVNLITITWARDERVEDSEDEPMGDTIHHWLHVLLIDYWCENMTLAREIQDEINRILWENAPNNSTRLPKSDAADSEADRFEKTELTFERIEPENPGIDTRPSWQSELMIHYRKRKS